MTRDSFNWIMEGDTNWFADEFDYYRKGTGVFHPRLELINTDDDHDEKENNFYSINSVFPDDLLERILASLPIASILKVCCVCKKWNEIVHTRKFMMNVSSLFSRKPWYFMFTCSDEPTGHAYDPVLRNWYTFDLPYIRKPSWFIASSCGLACIMDNESKIELCVCNPLTKEYNKIHEPLGAKFVDYRALAISVDRSSLNYTIVLVRTKQAFEDFLHWDISIHVYCSETMSWESPLRETLAGWRGGDVSVICDGVLYFMVHSTGEMNATQNLHGLLTYKLSGYSSNEHSNSNLIGTLIEVPCFLTCGRLMNLEEKLVMVGGIGRRDRPGIIKGIGIWVLRDRKWEEVSQMPHKFFQGFGEFDDVFASSGCGDLIYIQSFGGTALLVFDMNLKQWIWSQKCPVTKRFPLQIFTGFCFEPRLESSP